MPVRTESLARRPLRGIRSLAIAGVLAIGGALVFASPAFAHDELISSDPAPDSVLTEAPAAVTLTFSAELTTGEGATDVQVLDPAGTAVNDGDAVTEGTTVTQPLSPDLDEGAYRVLWKVVSGDGHPTSAEFSFTVEEAQPAPTSTPSESASAPDEPSEEATVAPSASEAPLPVDEADSSSNLPWVLLGIVGAAILGGIVYLLVSRSRRRRETEAIRASQAAALSAGTPATAPHPGGAAPESAPDTDR